MSAPHPLAPLGPPAPVPRPPWTRLVIGCAIAGGLAIVAGFAALLIGMYWLTSAGTQYPTGAVASPRTQGVIHVSDLTADPGAVGLLSAFFRRVQEASQSEGPQMPAWIRNLQAQQARQGITQWLPREATVSLEPDEEGTPRILVAANLRGFVQPIRMAVTQGAKGDKKTRVSEHAGHEVLDFAGGTSVCFMDGTLVVSYHAAALPPALDRLAARATPAPDADHAIAGKWDVRGWLAANPTIGLLVALATPEDGEATELHSVPEGLRDMRFGIDLESADRARVSAEVGFESEAQAAAGREWLDRVAAAIGERLGAKGVHLTTTGSGADARARYDLTLDGLDAAMEQSIARQERTRRPRNE